MRNGRSREGGWNAYGNQARLEHCRGGHLCVASTRSGQAPFKGVRLWLTSSTALLMSVSPEVEPPPDASEDVAEDASDDEAATEARHTASASSCIARMCLVFLLFVLLFKIWFYNSFFNKRLSQLSNRKVRHRARVLTGAAVLCPRPLDGGVSHCVPAFIACLLISFTRPRPQYRARPLPCGARLIRIANRHHQHHPPLPAPVSVWRACADLIRPCPRIPSTAISAPHNAPRNAIPLRARHTVTSPRYPSGLEAAADHQRDWRSYWDVAVHVLQT